MSPERSLLLLRIYNDSNATSHIPEEWFFYALVGYLSGVYGELMGLSIGMIGRSL